MNQRNGFYQVDTERMDMDAQRPYDWQDKTVIWSSIVALVVLAFLLVP